MKIQKDADSMGQDFTNQAMVEVPQIMDANAGDGKAFGQVRSHSFDCLAHPGTEFEQGRTLRRGHAVPRRRHDKDSVPFSEQGEAKGIDKAFVGRDETGK